MFDSGLVMNFWLLQSGEGVEVRVPGFTLQRDAGIAAFAGDVYQASLLQDGEVVGDGGGAEGLVLIEGVAEEVTVASDLAQHGETPGIGYGAGDELHLLVGQRGWLGNWHPLRGYGVYFASAMSRSRDAGMAVPARRSPQTMARLRLYLKDM